MDNNSDQNSSTENNSNQTNTYTINYTADVMVHQLHNPVPEFGGVFGPLTHTHNLVGQITWQEQVSYPANQDPFGH